MIANVQNITGHTKFRVPVQAIGEFLGVLDPGDCAMIEYKTGPSGEHYVCELSCEDDFLACVDSTLGVVPITA